MFRDPPAAPHQQPGGEPAQPQLLPGVHRQVAGAAAPGQDTLLATGRRNMTTQIPLSFAGNIYNINVINVIQVCLTLG